MKRLVSLLSLSVFIFAPAAAQPEDRTRFGRAIVIEPGETAGNVTCFACSIRVRGTVQGDLVSLLGGIEIEGAASGDVICFACSIRVRGAVQGDLVSLLSGIAIEGAASGDAVAVGGSIRLRPGARLDGDAVAVGGPVLREASATINGDAVPVVWFHLPGQRRFFWRGVLAFAAFQFGLLLVFYPLVRRQRVGNIAATLARHPVWTLLAGVGVAALVGLIVIVAVRFEYWSNAAGYVFNAVLLVIGGMGALGVYMWLGRKAAPASPPFAAVALGAALAFLLQLVPLAGFLACLLLCLLALGVAVLSGFGSFPRGASAAPAATDHAAAPAPR